jgi:hypothetical protein
MSLPAPNQISGLGRIDWGNDSGGEYQQVCNKYDSLEIPDWGGGINSIFYFPNSCGKTAGLSQARD